MSKCVEDASFKILQFTYVYQITHWMQSCRNIKEEKDAFYSSLISFRKKITRFRKVY